MNITFFTSRASYNRKENLELIVSVLRNRWKLNIEASSRDDILLDGKFKISFYSFWIVIVLNNLSIHVLYQWGN